MKDLTIAEQLGVYAASISLNALPPPVLRRIKICMADAIECCFSSSTDIRKQGAYTSIDKVSHETGCTLWNTGSYASLGDAAFYNGVTGAISSRNDISRIAKSHPGSVIIPSVLAAAEMFHLSGTQVLKGILAGYEIMIRYGNTLRLATLPNSFRGTAFIGPMGAAAATATALGLSSQQITSAISFAIHNGFGLNEWAWAGTGEDVLQNGWACRNGIQAVMLAKAGIPGAKTIFEGPCGLLPSFHAMDKAEYLTEHLGKTFHIMDVRFKEISACMNVQTAGQAAQTLACQHNINAADIGHIEIQVAGQSKNWPGCDNIVVTNLVQAIMSIQFTVAQAIVHKNCSSIKWEPPYEPSVTELMKRCNITENSGYSDHHYERQSASIIIHMKDSTTYRYHQPDVQTLDESQVLERFRRTMTACYNAGKAGQLVQTILNLDQETDVCPFVRQLI